ncbi:MAG: hypothetical protein L0J59_10895 [Lactococcus lactis]|nr:hypothetical protein [Lactococcus lactis]
MTTFLFIGCAEDEFVKPSEEVINHTDDDSPVLEKINYNQFINQSYFSEAQKQASFGKSTYSTDSTGYYDVSLEKINQVTKDQTISYTFLINGKMNESSAFENFMIKEDQNGNLSYYIITYTENASEFSFPYNSVIKPIDESDIEYTTNAIRLKVMPIDDTGGSNGCEQIIETILQCDSYGVHRPKYCCQHQGGVHGCGDIPPCSEVCSGTTIYTMIDYSNCNDGGSGDEGGGDEGGGDDGWTPPSDPNPSEPTPPTGGGGDQDESPTITSPNHNFTPQDPEECPDLEGDLDGNCSIDDYEACLLEGYNQEVCDCVSQSFNIAECQENENCQSLKELTQTDELSANILPVVNELRNKTSLEVEYSVHFEKNITYSDGEYEYVSQEGIEEGISLNKSYFRSGTRVFGQIHTHPAGTQPIFSWSDVARMKDLFDGLNSDFTKGDIFMMIVNHDGSVYAMKIDNFDLLSSAVQDDLDNADGVDYDAIEENLMVKIIDLYADNSGNLEAAFLNRFKNFGVSLYRATDQNLNNWEKLELQNPNDINSTVNPTLCNE